ncbi:hypothetical protein A374_06736 [Fictibacillus macauensis ZFHKF-1]|uniref:Uncharacterized protein n=1 Tax=Fictibacillus macauensis ZFHKF-1 TaxID=1196324 RepID=I8UH90_9BACL|nr:hypothetical protein [Fictibacillus macauensis]EIT86275.1 hypothetical protein A374_06736 [Fictibacillus macauensis ZFHKF-1]
MKRVLRLFSTLALGGLLLSSSSEAFAASKPTTLSIVQKEMQTLNSLRPEGGYKAEKFVSAHLTGKKIPEITAIYVRNHKGFIDSMIRIYQYDLKTKKWNKRYEVIKKNGDQPYSLQTKGKLLDHKKEQVVLGTHNGTGRFLSTLVLGSFNGTTVKTLLQPSHQYFGGSATIRKHALFLKNGSIVADRYTFKKNRFVRSKGTGADDRIAAGNVDHYLYFDHKKNGATVFDQHHIPYFNVTQTAAFVRKDKRDNKPVAYRLFVGNRIVQFKGSNLYFLEGGYDTWVIEPEAYGKKIKVKIEVTE